MARFPQHAPKPNTNPRNRWRAQRKRALGDFIVALSKEAGREISVLDVGGRAAYWHDVGTANISSLAILNSEDELLDPKEQSRLQCDVTHKVGDGCALDFDDNTFDLVHSNSVIEHVGAWGEMVKMANESVRVGRNGWVQTPAWECPVEPHFQLPFIHWFSSPLQRRLLRFSPRYHSADFNWRRRHADRINLLSRKEVDWLFPNAAIETERFGPLPKSYVVTWTSKQL